MEIRKNSGLDVLPKVLIKYLSLYLDIDSLINFSSINQKYKNIFIEFRNAFYFLNITGFLSNLTPKNQFRNRSHFYFLYRGEEIRKKKENTKKLILNKEFVDLKDNSQMTTLHYALKSKKVSLEMIKFFIENKSDLNLRDEYGYSALHFACRNENISPQIINNLLENKKDLLDLENAYGETALHLLCKTSDLSLPLIECLIKKKSRNKCEK